MTRLNSTLHLLYKGRSRLSTRFRLGLLAFDLFTIGFFVIASMIPAGPWIWAVDFVIAVVLTVDLTARFSIARNKLSFFVDPIAIADVVVIGTLIAATFIENWAFLRVLRALRLLRSYHVLRDLRQHFRFFANNEQVIVSTVNLFVFIFFVTALVYVLEVNVDPQINSYIDALYFTVTTLTTTGFGDITLDGEVGRLLSVAIMVVGVALFLRLVQTIFRPHKVRHPCPTCGLNRHDPDAVHCKHCGAIIRIETEGE
ncbi:MAG: potassium channel family protein [Rhodospirillales bacterium]|nr:potassium channel family protein [Rhodospirillales bacterium]